MIVARFSCLTDTAAEHVDVPVDVWLDMLSCEPLDEFKGKLVHPGWAPAEFSPPRREAAHVKAIHALVLDYDRDPQWDSVVALWRAWSGVVYTTKSHGAEGAHAERYRVVIAMDRPVSVAEYEAIWRWASARSDAVGMPVDPMRKDVSSSWYAPTRPPGGWRSERLAGPPLDVQQAIADAPAAPVLHVVPYTPSTADDVDRRIRRARAYVARMPPAVSGDSGHTTMFNAVCATMFGFDLGSDETMAVIAEEYNPRCDPPFTERELRHKVANAAKRCKRQRGYLLGDEPAPQRQSAMLVSVPQPTPQQPTPASPATRVTAPSKPSRPWTHYLLASAEGGPRKSYHNTAVFVRLYPEFAGKWSFDEMAAIPYYDGQRVTGDLISSVRAKADYALSYTPPVADIEAAISQASRERSFHPVQSYLRGLTWDGEPRLQSMARDYLGVNDQLSERLVRLWMIGAATRALDPGCKLDTALMLVGPTGFKKSSFFDILGGEWYADSYIDISSKDGTHQLHSAWIYEFAELENVINGRTESRVKAWMSSRRDLFRVPYARVPEFRPRSSVLCGTSNLYQILSDPTGNRRYWIIDLRDSVLTEVPKTLLAEMRDQLWAEAVCCFDAGEQWWLEREEELAKEEHNEKFMELDSWHNVVAAWLETVRHKSRVTTDEVLRMALEMENSKHDRAAQMRVGRILRELQWTRKKMRVDGSPRPVWCYLRPGTLDI